VGAFASVGTASSVNNVTVSGNGSKIMELSENLIVDLANANVNFGYFGATQGWRFL
jgi:hypothetical protein